MVQILAHFIQIGLGALVMLSDYGVITVGPLTGPEPLKAGMFTVVGAALVIGGLGGLVGLNPQPEPPSRGQIGVTSPTGIGNPNI